MFKNRKEISKVFKIQKGIYSARGTDYQKLFEEFGFHSLSTRLEFCQHQVHVQTSKL